MSFSHSWHDNSPKHIILKPLQQNTMSILTMPTSSSNPIFRNDLSWDMARPHISSPRTRVGSKNVSLPSIRQTFPDLLLDNSLEYLAANCPSGCKTTASSVGPPTSPGNPCSPNTNKKRRVSFEQDLRSQRASQVPRLHKSPEGPQPRRMSPIRGQQPTSPPNEGWQVARTNSHSTHLAGGHTSPKENATYTSQGYKFPYHEPPRTQSVSTATSSSGPSNMTPFSAGLSCQPHHQDTRGYGYAGATGYSNDVRQRKRRGNLPRETTDKLRAWFVAHLQHPYPTEDEKQALMRQTGLQMNQISNWFINARRRQLPAMINNARAESDAIHNDGGGSVESNAFASTEKTNGYVGRREEILSYSDDEGKSYEDISTVHQRTAAWLNRESI